jgi:hypothetical protein
MAAKLPQVPLSDDTFDPFDYTRIPVRSRRHRRSKLSASGSPKEGWTPVITDDWPERIRVSDAELDLFEAQFGGLLDDLLSPRK